MVVLERLPETGRRFEIRPQRLPVLVLADRRHVQKDHGVVVLGNGVGIVGITRPDKGEAGNGVGHVRLAFQNERFAKHD
jgi:hypothetical protein